MTELNKFVNLFHSIQGANSKEKKKNFNEFRRLLRSNITNEDDINNLILSISPTTPFEESFKIDIMLEFKTKDLLLQELKRCNRICLKKLLKDWKLFREIFSDIKTDDLMNTILPHLSYSLRLKVLNGISKNVTNEKHLDGYFLALEKKYGMDSAAVVLPACSVELIKSRIKKYRLKLPSSHLQRIFKKDPEFVDFYFDAIKHALPYTDLSYKYSNMLKYVARTKPDTYWKLQEKHKFNIKFGKYLTPKMIRTHKNITEQGYDAFHRFHNLKMYKTMVKENKLNDFLLHLYPETHDNFVQTFVNRSTLQFIGKAPRWKWFNLISIQFNRKYNRDLLNYPDYFNEDLLKITPLKERESILDIKVKDHENLYYLYGTKTSVPKFKQYLQHSSKSEKRCEYASSIYKTCVANDDQDTLLEFLQHVIIRYKNDTNFLKTFYETSFIDKKVLQGMKVEIWDCLAEIEKILDHSNVYTWRSYEFCEMYTEKLIRCGRPMDDYAKSLVKRLVDGKIHNYVNIADRKYRQMFCDKLAHGIDEYKDHERYQFICCQFLHYVTQTCKLKPDEVLAYVRFFDQLKIDDWNSANVIKHSVTLDNDVIHDLFWKLSQRYGTRQALLWYGHNRPDLLVKHADKLLDIIEKFRIEHFALQLKPFLDQDVLEKLKTHALEYINGDNFDKKEDAIAILSVVSPDTLLELISQYYPPEDGKIDTSDPPEKTKVQQAFLKGLKSVGDPARTFQLALKFCVGDYLKFALTALYHISYNTSELLVGDYLKGLSNTALSVRKHLLLLARHLYPLEDFTTLLKTWSDKEKNPSMRNIIFKKTVQYFCTNPTQNLWILLKRNLESIDAEDREIFDFALKFQNIPLEYLTEYIETIYETIAKNPDCQISEKRFDLINSIPDNLIDKFSMEFLKKLIKETVCCEPSRNFHWKCVFHVGDEKRSELFEENFVHFSRYVQEQGTNSTRNIQIRTKISNFLLEFLRLGQELKKGGELVNHFMSKWLDLFAPENFVREFLMMEFYDLAVKSDFDVYEIGNKINRLLYHYIDKYNESVIDSFCRQLRDFLVMMDIRYKQEKAFRFVEGFFRDKRDENIYIALLYFLPTTEMTIDGVNAQYVPIFEEIAKRESPAVRYYIDYYLTGEL